VIDRVAALGPAAQPVRDIEISERAKIENVKDAILRLARKFTP